MDLEGLGRMGQTSLAPLGIPRLAGLLLGAQLGRELALQAFNDDQGFCPDIPCPDGAWPTSFSGVSRRMLSSEPPCLSGEQQKHEP
jgi:hypothetical protein